MAAQRLAHESRNRMIKLYKFRPLGDECSFCRARRIIEADKFWCSHFWELNDPMEGVFTFNPSGGIDASVVFGEKSDYAICSFSGEPAFYNPVMWGYYANAFKGIAIEIEIKKSKICKVKYKNTVPAVSGHNDVDGQAKRLLTTKLAKWKHEHEYRFLSEQESGPHKIGDITKICFGDPHSGLVNTCEIYRKCPAIPRYHAFRDELKSIASERDICCTDVRVPLEEGVVKPVSDTVA